MTSTSSFPAALDTWTNPNAANGDTLATVPHDAQHAKANDAIAAIQTKLGMDSSADTASMDYQLHHKQPLMTAGSAPATVATNSPTNAPTNYGALAAILGADVNATNTKQNTTATNLNDLSTKFNALVAILQGQGLLS